MIAPMMKMKSKGRTTLMVASAIALTFALLYGFGTRSPLQAQPQGSEKSPVFVNITRGQDDLHAVCMGLGLAKNALANGHKVVVFLNVHAPIFASRDLSEDLKFADFPPIKTLMSQILSEGGKVLVCGHCAHLTGVKSEQLVKGAILTEHGELFQHLPPHNLCFSY